MKTQFTKEKWLVIGNDIYADGNKIATTYKPKHESQVLKDGESQTEMMIRTQPEREAYRAEWEANHSLIAASPLMYEHLLNIVHFIELEKENVSGALLAEMDSIKRTLKRIEL